jgi:hypothetical protein
LSFHCQKQAHQFIKDDRNDGQNVNMELELGALETLSCPPRLKEVEGTPSLLQ